jgi:hypothetical protein
VVEPADVELHAGEVELFWAKIDRYGFPVAA